MTATTIFDYTHQLIRGLHYLHEGGLAKFGKLFHGDFKTDNILIKACETGMQLKIADLDGFTRLAGLRTRPDDHTSRKGTPHFTSPEMLIWEDTTNSTGSCVVGRSTDIWSL